MNSYFNELEYEDIEMDYIKDLVKICDQYDLPMSEVHHTFEKKVGDYLKRDYDKSKQVN